MKSCKKLLLLFSCTGGENGTEGTAVAIKPRSPEPAVFPKATLALSAPSVARICPCSTALWLAYNIPSAGHIWLLSVQQKFFLIPFRYSSSGLKTPQNTSINMQLPSRETTPYFNNTDQKDLVGYSSSRANSVPIIPSVGLDEACMQMQNVSEVTGIKWCKNSYSAELVNVSSPVSNCLIAEQHEVKILLETVQEQIRILTDARRSEDFELTSVDVKSSASENTAFLPMSPVAKADREAQFVLKSETQRDSALTKWLCVGVAGGGIRDLCIRCFAKQERRKLNTNYLYALI